ncbi:MAG TPA: BA14K family protein [Xanthobacteraceae bacterium]|nr:BA14K family protein [Xanthobacteraceae bacterium]
MPMLKSTLVLSVVAALGFALPASVSALPLSPGNSGTQLSGQLDHGGLPIIQVRRRGGGGAGVAAGIIGGIIAGGIIASQRPYYSYEYGSYYYPYYPPYYGPYPTRDAAIAYCMRRFRSYDPYSMTYLGYDGFRHPCP